MAVGIIKKGRNSFYAFVKFIYQNRFVALFISCPTAELTLTNLRSYLIEIDSRNEELSLLCLMIFDNKRQPLVKQGHTTGKPYQLKNSIYNNDIVSL